MTKTLQATISPDVEILTAAEIQQIDAAVTFINSKANESAKSLVDIGAYLLETFFDNDIKKAEDRAPRKGISLRKLADHRDIMLSYRSLANAMRLADQNHLFMDAKYHVLTESHRLLLLQVDTEKSKMKFADQTVKDKLSVRGLRDMLIQEGCITPRGRGALPAGKTDKDPADAFSAFIKPISKLVKLDLPVDKIAVDGLSGDQIQAIEKLKDRLEAILAKVGKAKK